MLFLILLFIRYNFCSDQFLFKRGRFRDINTEIFNMWNAVPTRQMVEDRNDRDNFVNVIVMCLCVVMSFDSWSQNFKQTS